jgi:hypothetical protein
MVALFKLATNVGGMKSWLVPTFQTTTNADSQFFILRVIKRFLLCTHQRKTES